MSDTDAIISLQIIDRCAYLNLAGELDCSSVTRLRRAFDDAVHADCNHITIDAAELSFVDSTAIGVLVAARGRLGAVSLTIVNLTGLPRRVIDLTGTASYLGVDTSSESMQV